MYHKRHTTPFTVDKRLSYYHMSLEQRIKDVAFVESLELGDVALIPDGREDCLAFWHRPDFQQALEESPGESTTFTPLQLSEQTDPTHGRYILFETLVTKGPFKVGTPALRCSTGVAVTDLIGLLCLEYLVLQSEWHIFILSKDHLVTEEFHFPNPLPKDYGEMWYKRIKGYQKPLWDRLR